MISERYVEEIEEDSDDQDVESGESDSHVEGTYENIRDMTASNIKILKMSHEVNQIFEIWVCGSDFVRLQQLAKNIHKLKIQVCVKLELVV